MFDGKPDVPTVLELRNVTKSFAGVSALEDVSLSLVGGEIHCVAGQNGSGKSTLIKIISGVHRPDSGEIVVDGRSMGTMTPRGSIAAGIQVIYQDFSLFPNLSVAENLALASLLRDGRKTASSATINAIATRALRPLGVTLPLEADVGALPVAGKQLVAVARALTSAPRLLIMDEPTTALTHQEVAALLRVVREIARTGVAVLFVSHRMREIFEISDRLTVLRSGRVVASGPTANYNEISLTRAMTGTEFHLARYVHAANTAAPRLEVRGFTVPGRFTDIEFNLQRGEILGVCGLLGAGRTELALALFGMRPNYSGSVSVDGAPVELRCVQAAVDHGIAYVPEDRMAEGLFFAKSILSNTVSANIGTSKQWFVRWSRLRHNAEATLHELNVVASSERMVQELSGGNQQRVVLSRSLLTRPRILLLNCPTAGVDIGAKAELHRVIRKLASEHGMSVLMISDEISELLLNCNRIVMMHHGRFVESFDVEGLSEKDIVDKLRTLS